MGTKYTYIRIPAPNAGLDSLKAFTRRVNEQFETLTMKVYGNVEMSDLHKATQLIIDAKVNAAQFAADLAEKADIGDLAYIGETPPETPVVNKVWLNVAVVPNEWLRWTGVVTETARSYSASETGASVTIDDLSDVTALALLFKTLVVQAGTGTPSRSNIRALSEATTVTVTVNGTNTVLTPVTALGGVAGAEDEIGSDGSEAHKTILLSLTGAETVVSAGIDATAGATMFRARITLATAMSTTSDSVVGKLACSHFVGITANAAYAGTEGISGSSTGAYLYLTIPLSVIGCVAGDTDTAKSNAVKAWLAAQVTATTPVQVDYARATPTTAEGTAVTFSGVAGENTINSTASSLTVEYTGSGWRVVGDTTALATLVSEISGVTIQDGDFRTLMENISHNAAGLWISGIGGTFQLLLGPARIGFYQSGEEVAYITGSKLYIKSAEIVSEIKIGNYFLSGTADGGMVIK